MSGVQGAASARAGAGTGPGDCRLIIGVRTSWTLSTLAALPSRWRSAGRTDAVTVRSDPLAETTWAPAAHSRSTAVGLASVSRISTSTRSGDNRNNAPGPLAGKPTIDAWSAGVATTAHGCTRR